MHPRRGYRSVAHIGEDVVGPRGERHEAHAAPFSAREPGWAAAAGMQRGCGEAGTCARARARDPPLLFPFSCAIADKKASKKGKSEKDKTRDKKAKKAEKADKKARRKSSALAIGN